jgi:predicted nucleic acid-binding protein
VILVDTSVWVDYLRGGDPALVHLLESDQVCTHDYVIGELACGNLRNRSEVLGLLQSLPRLVTATEDETLFFIENRKLMGRGIGYIDALLLVSTILRGARLWTKDRSLRTIAEESDCAHPKKVA